uniref:indole-3-acetic acid-induced protein ARG7-like n=1 Tax=Erigeron canadensis TaxID=72917 RepID=UPI001CB98A29|nr:indole-3-acetic acid-induced protein ARG7-like [Erigeron canadensis]
MESPKKGKKNFLTKTWKRCRSFPSKKNVAPEGFFPVYVGPEKQWFAVKMKYANHPLFRMLLEDAEIEYGYDTPGPLLLPCDVDLFYKVVAEMEANEMEQPRGCGFVYGSCSPFNPSRRIGNARGNQMAKGYGGYGLLTPSRLLMN